LQQTAHNIAKNAVELAKDATYLSPFAISARENGINYIGSYILNKNKIKNLQTNL